MVVYQYHYGILMENSLRGMTVPDRPSGPLQKYIQNNS